MIRAVPASAGFPLLTYLTSAHRLDQLPANSGIEIAVAGRSNAGKSSAINRICRQHGLAKTSKLPGRTRQLVVFSAADERLLVDLPGYGFARVTEQLRRHWQRVISAYLTQRRTLVGVIVVMDVRRPLQDLDTEFLALCTAAELPVHILLSKADKISRGAAKATLQQTEASLRGRGWETSVQLFSSLSGDGVDPARDLLLRWWKEGRPRLENKGDFARAGA